MSSEQTSIYAKILSFVNEVKNAFTDEPIQLYYKLLKHTSISNTDAIIKHNEIFKKWILTNSVAIKDNNIKDCTEEGITFSARVYIPIKKIAISADKDTYDALCTHLQLLLFQFQPSEDLANALISHESKPSGESEFINNFMTKIETNFKDKQFNNPMEAMMDMFSSGVFTELVDTMKEGVTNKSLNLNKLLGDVQGMVGTMSPNAPDLTQMAGMMGSGSTSSPSQPNIGDMMGMMSSMMNMLGGNKQA